MPRQAFWLAALCLASAGVLLLAYRPAQMADSSQVKTDVSNRELLGNPTLLLAIVSGASAYMVMSFVMTATPMMVMGAARHALRSQDGTALMWLRQLANAMPFVVTEF